MRFVKPFLPDFFTAFAVDFGGSPYPLNRCSHRLFALTVGLQLASFSL